MSPDTLVVERATEVTDELLQAFSLLLPQLSTTNRSISREHLAEIISSPMTTLLVARLNGAIVGSLTLVMFRIPTALRAWIEDVVVDDAVRGRKVGEALTREAVRIAEKAKAKTVDLTSRQSRVAAHRLYEKCGFMVRETSVYRYGSK
jgi:ribosomal protein S18 acetylase RimI-like enzyme